MRNCCVPGCNSGRTARFSVPRNKNVQEIWLSRIQNQKLYKYNAINNCPSAYQICARHFDSMCFEKENKLKKFSLPTLNLPGYSGESTFDTCFRFPLADKPKDFLLEMPEKVREMLNTLKPSLTGHLKEEEELEVTKPKTTYCVPSQRKQKEFLRLANAEGLPVNHSIINDHLYTKPPQEVVETVSLNNIIMNTTEELADTTDTTCIDLALTDKSLNSIRKDTVLTPSYDTEMDCTYSDSIQVENNEAGCSKIILDHKHGEKPSSEDHEYCKPSATDTVKAPEKLPQTQSPTIAVYAIVKKLKKKTKKNNTVEQPFFSNILQRSMFEADIIDESYDFQNEDLLPTSSSLADTPIFPELESVISNVVTNPQYKSYIKAVIIVRGEKIVNLVSLKQLLRLPKYNSILQFKNENTNTNIKEKIKKLVSKISGNKISKVDRSETLKAFMDIQGILNSNSYIYEVETSPEGKNDSEIVLKELLSKLGTLMPKKPKKTRNRQEIVDQVTAENMETTEIVEMVKKPKKRYYPHCRLCLEVIFGEHFSLSGTSPKGHPIKDMLATCLPEINSASSHKPVLCPSCMLSLSVSYEFKMKCLQSEEKINKYRTVNVIPDDKTVYLKYVVKKFCNNNNEEAEVDIRSGEASNSKIDSSEKENQINVGNEKVPIICEEEEDEEIQPNNYDVREEHTDKNLVKFTFDVSKINFDATPKESVPRKNYYLNKTNGTQKTYKCHVCYRKFILERRLKLHYYRDHDISKLYMCKLCGKYFKDVLVLRQHINRIHCVLSNVKKTSKSDFDVADQF